MCDQFFDINVCHRLTIGVFKLKYSSNFGEMLLRKNDFRNEELKSLVGRNKFFLQTADVRKLRVLIFDSPKEKLRLPIKKRNF